MEWLKKLEGEIVGLDTIQIATAIQEKASFFVTNDVRLATITDLEVLVLDSLLI